MTGTILFIIGLIIGLLAGGYLGAVLMDALTPNRAEILNRIQTELDAIKCQELEAHAASIGNPAVSGTDE